jgi:hypothetical protein
MKVLTPAEEAQNLIKEFMKVEVVIGYDLPAIKNLYKFEHSR